MQKQIIFCYLTLIVTGAVCFAQLSSFKSAKSATRGATIVDLEKSITQAFKDKQVERFKKYLAPDFIGVDADGIKDADAEVANVEKSDVHENAFTDIKVTFPSPDVAVITYKVTTQATSDGRDTSGTYNSASVWAKRGGKWLAVLHTFVKTQ
jgi:ketosteroid isomerase-like protein